MSSITKKALIITEYNLPDNDAGAVRVKSLYKLLKNIGYDVLAVGLGKFNNFEIEFNELKYISLRCFGNSIAAKIKSRVMYIKYLKKYLKDDKLQVVIVNEILLFNFLWIKRYCRNNNIILIFDCVEWYSSNQFKLRQFSLIFILNNLYNKYFIDIKIGVIAISRYLEKYFKNKNICTIRIPPIFDMREFNYLKEKNDGVIKFIYAGSFGKKDYLKTMLLGFGKLSNNEKNKIFIMIYGVEKTIVKHIIPYNIYDKIIKFVRFEKKIPRKKLLDEMKKYDYSILLRDETRRYSKAGFPSKIIESLATSTPVICNITSDLKEYLVNGYNSIIVEDCSAESFKKAIIRATNISISDRYVMQANSKKTAEKYFDLKVYENGIQKLIEEMQKK